MSLSYVRQVIKGHFAPLYLVAIAMNKEFKMKEMLNPLHSGWITLKFTDTVLDIVLFFLC